MNLLERVAASLQLPPMHIVGVASKASHAYKSFAIPKRNGGSRTIHHPSRKLKSLQRWLLRHVVDQWQIHDAAFAYRRGRNILAHASVHQSSRYLLRMDFAEFFPSIKAIDVSNYLDGHPAGEPWESSDKQLFVDLVCRHGCLTIGAPTSPAISNALCFLLDSSLSELAARADVRYTRYADDLFFSTTKPGILSAIPEQVAATLRTLTIPTGLRLNEGKTRHSSRKRRRQVTGITLSSDGRAVLGRARKRFIRRQLHCFDLLDAAERGELRGLLAYAVSVDQQLFDELVLKYGQTRVLAAWRTPREGSG